MRLSIDTSDNTVVLTVAEPDAWLWLRSADKITITDVQIWADGNRWSALEISDLQVLGITGGKLVGGNGALDRATAQGGMAASVRLARNGSQDFILDRPIIPSIEFGGGVDLPQTVRLADDLALRSRDGRIVVEGEGAASLNTANLRLAVSMAFGHPCWLRYTAAAEKLTMTFRQNLQSGASSDFIFSVGTDGYFDFEKAQFGAVEVIQRVLSYLNVDPGVEKSELHRLIEWFIAARSVRGLLDFRALCLFSFLEILDDSATLTGQSLARLLDVPVDAAKELALVRHQISHGRTSLHQAITSHPRLDPSFFGETTLPDFAVKPAATLMNYLVYVTNRLMLQRVGANLRPATWTGE